MISMQDAITSAKRKLDEIQVDYADREVSVSSRQVYEVVFQAPPNMRAGDFTLIIDPETNIVLAMSIER